MFAEHIYSKMKTKNAYLQLIICFNIYHKCICINQPIAKDMYNIVEIKLSMHYSTS